MVKTLKRTIRKSLTLIQKALAKNIDYLIENSEHNELMAELEKQGDFEKYGPYTQHRALFEQKLLQLGNVSYVKARGVLYQINSFNGILSFREAFTDYTRLNSRMRFSMEIIKHYFAKPSKIYLTEHNTPFHKLLAQQEKYKLVTSYYKPGEALHQDTTSLTYADNSFDVCLSFEDLEHIPDYKKAIEELHRVTKPGGHVLLSTPFILGNTDTLTRASINTAGEITHLLPPEYHGDPVIPQGILCFYHFGWSLLNDFRNAGFSSVKIITGFDIPKMMLGEQLFILAEK